MPTPAAPSSRTRIRRMPKRARYDAETVNAIVDAAIVCSVAFEFDGAVHAIPTIHWRDGKYLYIHGAKASRLLKALTDGQACVTITLVDGLVLARSAMHHSMNFRSVVVYGRFEPVTDPAAKLHALKAFTDGLYPGRWDRLRPITDKELNATSVLRVALDEASAKVRDGGAEDDEADLNWPVWAGVIPLGVHLGAPRVDERSVERTVPATRFSHLVMED